MTEHVKITFEGKTYDFPVVMGTEGEKAVDITNLRQKTGLITLDPGYANTGSCKSSITFMDGEREFSAIVAFRLKNLLKIRVSSKRLFC